MNEPAFERHACLKDRIKSWVDKKREVATTEDWFDTVYNDLNTGWIWCPPPALTKVAAEQLCEVLHLYPYSKNTFVCPLFDVGILVEDVGEGD